MFERYTACPPIEHTAIAVWRAAVRIVGERPTRLFKVKLANPIKVDAPPHGTIIIDDQWAVEFADGKLLHFPDGDQYLKAEAEASQRLRQAAAWAKARGMNVVWNECLPVSGRWESGLDLQLNPATATAYTLLHEAGHALVGTLCCREHCEFVAHGAALAFMHQLGMVPTEDDLRCIEVYAGRSVPFGACPAAEANKDKPESEA